jgi:hypothetical protein
MGARGRHQRGNRAEEHAREIAAKLGVEDFVYLPVLEAKGATQREISDGVLICGHEGVILQVKARRSPEGDTPDRARKWVLKHAKAAKRQADGTRRRLAESREVTFQSLRGFERTLKGVAGWPAVVILEHPGAPAGLEMPPGTTTMWITLADWQALHWELRSTAAVIGYVRRALDCGVRPPLGLERDRYLVLAEADAQAGGGPHSVPALPLQALSPEDSAFAALIDDLIEKVWPQDGPIAWSDPDDYRAIVELLDRIPPAMRARLGRKIIATLEAAIVAVRRRSFLLYDTSQDARLLFLCDVMQPNDREDRLMSEIALLASVRQHQAIESGADPEGMTLAIGIFHSARHGRQYSFALIGSPPPAVPKELRDQIEREYGVLRGHTIESL